ncbi:MAG: flagellar basal body P-ring protein FlgI [Planctomycetia bacterium]
MISLHGAPLRHSLVISLPLLVATAGCAGTAIRSQSPEVEALAGLEADTKLVGDYAIASGLGLQRIERAALVTGLPGTGSDPPPGPQRAMLLSDMQERGVVDPNTLLASPQTALVWVHAYLPPGVRKGDRFDVFVETPADTDTTSLAGGGLMETRLTDVAVLGNRVREGRVQGIVEGPLLVDPVANGTLDAVARIRARIPAGGVSCVNRPIGLLLAPEHRSVALSQRLGEVINRRFHAVVRGAKKGVATPKNDQFIEMEIPATYRHNLDRYVRVVRSVAVVEPAGGRHARLELLGRQLADPVTAPAAALRLEAIGKEAIPTLRGALDSNDAESRFAAAEALAYLGESVAASHLASAAAEMRSARPAALAALTVLDDPNGIDALQSLLSSASAETRYGAFRALWRMDRTMPLVTGDRCGDAFSLHVLDVKGPPLVHVTRSTRPEIVLFGAEHPLADGLRVEAGGTIVVVVEGTMATVSRFVPGQSDQSVEMRAAIEPVIRGIVELGGSYPDVVQFLQQASSRRGIRSRLAFDAIPSEYDGRESIHQEASARSREIAADRAVADDRLGDAADDHPDEHR